MAIFNSYFDRLPEGICTNLANFAIQCETPWCERTSRAWWSIDHPLKHCSLSKHHRWFRRKWADSWRWFRNTVWRLQNSRRTIRGRQRRFRRLRPHRGNSRRRFRQLSWRHQLRCPRWPRHLTLRLSHASLIKSLCWCRRGDAQRQQGPTQACLPTSTARILTFKPTFMTRHANVHMLNPWLS